ncbi:hypothetical protein [Colwellia sp. MEBiC06753]
MGKLLLIILASCALYFLDLAQSVAQSKTTINLYSYHLKPPLVIDQDQQSGIYYDLTRWLNDTSEQYHYELMFLPRKRIDKMLIEQKLNGVLIGVNPVWFDDRAENKYLWTGKIFTDQDEIVSLQANQVNYLGANSLIGKVFGGVRGFYYFGINELVEQEQIIRINTVKETDLFSMLLNQRVDFAVITGSTFHYIINHSNWQDKFFVSPRPHDVYDRRLLVPPALAEVYTELAPQIKLLSNDEQWHKLLHSYRGIIDN